MGLSGRPDRWPDLLPDHHPQPDPSALVGPVRHLEGWTRHLGRRGRRGPRGVLYVYRRLGSWTEVRKFADATGPSILVAQAIGRIGNYFNQELFGKPTTLPWGLEISPAHRPPGYTQFATFQPTFLYEMIWDLSFAGFLVWLGVTRRVKAPGLFALYVAGYSAFRMFEETLRIDYSNYFLGMRVNFWIATLLCLGGLAWFVAIQKGWTLRRGKTPPDVSLYDGVAQPHTDPAPRGKPRAKQVA